MDQWSGAQCPASWAPLQRLLPPQPVTVGRFGLVPGAAVVETLDLVPWAAAVEPLGLVPGSAEDLEPLELASLGRSFQTC